MAIRRPTIAPALATRLDAIGALTGASFTTLVNQAVSDAIRKFDYAAKEPAYRITQVYTPADEPLDETVVRLTEHLTHYRSVRIVRGDGVTCDLEFTPGKGHGG